ncbi:hypothetical protein SDC9_137308 [bioreactor metagenome]|uniref:Uncharacterized protein n=1 Tax=bioreactor metagenome TaxID=1076179 RepID=A0A645DLS3_9ZZZZ
MMAILSAGHQFPRFGEAAGECGDFFFVQFGPVGRCVGFPIRADDSGKEAVPEYRTDVDVEIAADAPGKFDLPRGADFSQFAQQLLPAPGGFRPDAVGGRPEFRDQLFQFRFRGKRQQHPPGAGAVKVAETDPGSVDDEPRIEIIVAEDIPETPAADGELDRLPDLPGALPDGGGDEPHELIVVKFPSGQMEGRRAGPVSLARTGLFEVAEFRQFAQQPDRRGLRQFERFRRLARQDRFGIHGDIFQKSEGFLQYFDHDSQCGLYC